MGKKPSQAERNTRQVKKDGIHRVLIMWFRWKLKPLISEVSSRSRILTSWLPLSLSFRWLIWSVCSAGELLKTKAKQYNLTSIKNRDYHPCWGTILQAFLNGITPTTFSCSWSFMLDGKLKNHKQQTHYIPFPSFSQVLTKHDSFINGTHLWYLILP